jgi:hypothetical protein
VEEKERIIQDYKRGRQEDTCIPYVFNEYQKIHKLPCFYTSLNETPLIGIVGEIRGYAFDVAVQTLEHTAG